jgi:hypothetical protein
MAEDKTSRGSPKLTGMEKFYRKQFPKLKAVQVGYMGGKIEDPACVMLFLTLFRLNPRVFPRAEVIGLHQL